MATLTPNSKKSVSLFLVAVLITAGAVPASARWRDNSQDLPGLLGSKSFIILGVAAAAGVTALVLWARHAKIKHDLDPVHIPTELQVRGVASLLPVTNTGPNTVQVSEIKCPEGFKLEPVGEFPIVLRPGEAVQLKVLHQAGFDRPRRLTPWKRPIVLLSLTEKEKTRTRLVVLAPEK